MAGICITPTPTVGPAVWVPSAVIGSSQSVLVNGLPVVLAGDTVTTHIKPGDNPSPISGAVIATSKVIIEGKLAAQIGDVASAGELLVGSSPNVFI